MACPGARRIGAFWRQVLQLDAIFSDAFSHHLFRNKHFEGIDKGIQHTLTDEILSDIDWYAPLRQVISLYLSHISALFLTQKREVHLWDDGEAAILIHYPYQGLGAARLIDMMTLAARLAERKGTVAQTLCLLHNPHVLILQFHKHGTECRLRNLTSLCRPRKIAKAVECHNVFLLL